MLKKYNNHSFSKTVHALIIAVSAMVIFLLLHFFSTHSFNRMSIEGTFPKSGVLKIYYAKMTHGFDPRYAFNIEVKGSDQPQTIYVQLHNRILHKLKFDLSSLSSSKLSASKPVTIKKITLEGFFQAKQTDIDLSAVNLSEEVSAGISLDQTELVITGSAPEIEVVSIKVKKHFFVHYVLPLFLTLLSWLLITSVAWRSFPAIEDLFNNQQSRNVNNLRSLDGLRGVAALTVLLEHTMGEFIGLGRAGVWLFFVLSGFLLVRSFILYPEKMMTLEGLKNYFLKRVNRVLPMFYFMITVIFLLRGKVDAAIRHYLLIQGDGHFWTILHELYFYMFLPFVACSVYFLFKKKYIWTILSLILLALVWDYLANPDLLPIYTLGDRRTPYFYVFLLGMATGYFYYGIYQSSESIKHGFTVLNKPLSMIALTAILIFFFYASNLGIIEENIAVADFGFSSAIIAAMLVLMSAITSETGIYNRILSLSILRLVGIVGYSFYLIHPYAIAIFKVIFQFMFVVPPAAVFPGIITTIGSFLIALPIAMFTYSYIERPFLKNKQ